MLEQKNLLPKTSVFPKIAVSIKRIDFHNLFNFMAKGNVASVRLAYRCFFLFFCLCVRQRGLHGEVCHEQLLWHWPGRQDLSGVQQQERGASREMQVRPQAGRYIDFIN